MKTLLILTSLLAFGAGQNPSTDNSACKQLDRFMLSVTNNTCSINLHNSAQVCTPFIEQFTTTSPHIIQEMVKLEGACKDEMMQTKPDALMKHLKKQQKLKKCGNLNLSDENRYICKKIKDDIAELSRQ